MNKQEIGRFYATSFNNIVFYFIVYDNNTMDCPTLNISSFERIELKPRFILRGKDFYYKYDAKAEKKYSNTPELIGNYNIDDDLFAYLKDNKMIRYSTDMAYLYDFTDKSGYDDNQYGVRSPYKRARKKGPILQMQKKGYFN